MYPNGAPNSACVRMDPSITRTHDGGRQDDSPPFKLVPSKKTGKKTQKYVETQTGFKIKRMRL